MAKVTTVLYHQKGHLPLEDFNRKYLEKKKNIYIYIYKILYKIYIYNIYNIYIYIIYIIYIYIYRYIL